MLIGFVLILIGGVLLLEAAGAVGPRIWLHLLRLWPFTLIILGVQLLFGQRAPWVAAALTAAVLVAAVAWAAALSHRDGGAGVHPGLGPSKATLTEDTIEVTALFGSAERKVTSPAFARGDVTAVLGSAEVDLRGAVLDSAGARLDLTAVMGSVQLTVPKGWHIVLEGTPVLGSVEDQRSGAVADPAAPRLVIEATAVLGSVQIRD